MLDPIVKEVDETVSSVATSLLSRARKNDQQSWTLLVEFHAPLVYRWCRSRGLNSDDTLDVGQEVFAAVAKNLDRFEREDARSTFRGWLRSITENKIRDHWRRNNREPIALRSDESLGTLPGEADASESLGPEVKTVFLQILEFAKHEISQQHWDVFWDLVVEEQAPADVAEKFQLQRHNVYMIKSRVLRLLRSISTEKGETEE